MLKVPTLHIWISSQYPIHLSWRFPWPHFISTTLISIFVTLIFLINIFDCLRIPDGWDLRMFTALVYLTLGGWIKIVISLWVLDIIGGLICLWWDLLGLLLRLSHIYGVAHENYDVLRIIGFIQGFSSWVILRTACVSSLLPTVLSICEVIRAFGSLWILSSHIQIRRLFIWVIIHELVIRLVASHSLISAPELSSWSHLTGCQIN